MRTVAIGLALAIAALAGGCITPAQQRFTIADVKAQATYIRLAQPAVERYCDALAATDAARAAQLRIDTRALAAELARDADLRIRGLRADEQALQAARTALAATQAVLDALEASGKAKEVPSGND